MRQEIVKQLAENIRPALASIESDDGAHSVVELIGRCHEEAVAWLENEENIQTMRYLFPSGKLSPAEHRTVLGILLTNEAFQEAITSYCQGNPARREALMEKIAEGARRGDTTTAQAMVRDFFSKGNRGVA